MFRGSKIIGTIFSANNSSGARKLLYIHTLMPAFTNLREHTYIFTNIYTFHLKKLNFKCINFKVYLFPQFFQKNAKLACLCMYICDINQNNATYSTQTVVLILLRTLLCFTLFQRGNQYGQYYIIYRWYLNVKRKIVLDIRMEQKLKYCEVAIPEVTDRKHGFNIECY